MSPPNFQRETHSSDVRRRGPSVARRSELENTPPYGEISSSTIQPLPCRQKIVPSYLSPNAPRRDEGPSSFPCGPSNQISRDRSSRAQLQETATRDHTRRTRVGSGKDYQLPSSRTIQEAPIPGSMEGIPTIRRFLGSRVGSFRSRPDRRLLHHTFPHPSETAI